jgi:hypothetical protein
MAVCILEKNDLTKIKVLTRFMNWMYNHRVFQLYDFTLKLLLKMNKQEESL